MQDFNLLYESFRGEPGPRLLITAGVHGDEYEPMVAIRQLSAILQEISFLGSVVLVPVVNVAAFLLGQRTAEDGLDLARVCPGDPDGSITERTGSALASLIRSSDYYIDLHTGGKALTLYPLAGYMLHPDHKVLDVQRRMAGAFNLPLIWGTTPDLDGRSISVARDANIPAIYVEIGGGAGFNAQAVGDMADGCLNVMSELKMLHRVPPASRVRYTAETPGKQTGYLQINYPSPIHGLFEPAVKTGDIVKEGDWLGRVLDPRADDAQWIAAEENGLVVMLRADPHVREQDALATIIPHIGANDA